jgi:hypothetical protein
MMDLDIPEDVSGIEVMTPQRADSRIDWENQERQREAEAANAGGDMDDFRYLRPRWFRLETKQGEFVASIKSAGGGGRVSNPPDPSDYDNTWIKYNLYARIQEPRS